MELLNMNTCYNCPYIGYDVDLNGYCNNSQCVYYKHIVIDDNGCIINKDSCCVCKENDNNR